MSYIIIQNENESCIEFFFFEISYRFPSEKKIAVIVFIAIYFRGIGSILHLSIVRF